MRYYIHRPYSPRLTAEMVTAVDRDAMTRAIAEARASNPRRRHQIDAMLREQTFEDVGDFAAGSRQRRNLGLKPFEDPPTNIWPPEIDDIIARGPVDNREYPGACLLKKLLAAGLSQYEPDPLVALKEVKGAAAAHR